VSAYVVLLSFPLVFLGELADKTMFASLLMATWGRPWHVWLGAAASFVVHVAIAVSVGAALLALLPRRAVDAVVAFAFAAGAVYALLSARSAGDESIERRHERSCDAALRQCPPRPPAHGIGASRTSGICGMDCGPVRLSTAEPGEVAPC
jgi:putative Ca2+/H+ antiporter (TMEM165/GDT1 family)